MMDAEPSSVIVFEYSKRTRFFYRHAWRGAFWFAIPALLLAHFTGRYRDLWVVGLTMAALYLASLSLRHPAVRVTETGVQITSPYTGKPKHIPFSSILSMKDKEGASLILTYLSPGATRQATIQLSDIQNAPELVQLLSQRTSRQPEKLNSAGRRAFTRFQEYAEVYYRDLQWRVVIPAIALFVLFIFLKFHYEWVLSEGVLLATVAVFLAGTFAIDAMLRRRKSDHPLPEDPATPPRKIDS